MNKKIGMTLGKFIPFHAGHESLIRQMYQDGCDKIYVCVYEVPDFPVSTIRRARWIEQMFYGIDNIEVIPFNNSPQGVGYSEEIKKLHEDYFESEMLLRGYNANDITHFYCSEPYGYHMSERFNWELVLLDNDRNDIQVSATKIRENGKDNFKFLHPIVQKDMPKVITLLGGESSGKTTLGQAMEAIDSNYRYIKEYGADYWYEHNKDGELDIEDLLNIMSIHNKGRRKEMGYCNHKYYIEDTNNITTYLFGLHYGVFDSNMEEAVVKNCKDTDLYVLILPNIPFDPSGGRISEEVRQKFTEQYLDILIKYNLKHFILRGVELDNRINTLKWMVEQINE